MPEVVLLHASPLMNTVKAIRKCYESEGLSDSNIEDNAFVLGPKDEALIKRIIQSGHESTLEHAVFTFDIAGVSRGLLQELARHRIASPSVKSTRYTLGRIKYADAFVPITVESKAAANNYIVFCNDDWVNYQSMIALEQVRLGAVRGVPNDQLKYCLPESFKTTLVWTINARSLRNFFKLRLSERALWEIRLLAADLAVAVPEEHKILFYDLM